MKVMSNYELYSESGKLFFKFPEEMCILDEVFKDMATHGHALYEPYLRKVIEGEVDSICIGGNNSYLQIYKDYTICSCEFTTCPTNEYVIQTKWLYELVIQWRKLNGLEE